MLEWDDLRFLLAVARHGSLTGASKALRVTQPTVGRRLSALESRVGSPLFDRTATGLELTALGRQLAGIVERMEGAALAAERCIAGQEVRLEGRIRITCIEWFGNRILTPALVRFSDTHPAISAEVISDTRQLSLTKRETDLAFRFSPFEQFDLVHQRIGDLEVGLYAGHAYLEKFGLPDLSNGLVGHAIATLYDEARHVPEVKWILETACNARVAFRSNSSESIFRAVEAGAGIAVLPRFLGDSSRHLRRLDTAEPLPTRGIWLGVHEDLRHVPRIRALIDYVVPQIKSALSPP